jgi:hypothetical protein
VASLFKVKIVRLEVTTLPAVRDTLVRPSDEDIVVEPGESVSMFTMETDSPTVPAKLAKLATLTVAPPPRPLAIVTLPGIIVTLKSGDAIVNAIVVEAVDPVPLPTPLTVTE